MELRELVLDLLARLLQERGHSSTRQGAFLDLGSGSLAVTCHDVDHRNPGSTHLVGVLLEVLSSLTAGAGVVEQAVGRGATIEAAIYEALASWHDGVLAVLREVVRTEPSVRDAGAYELPVTQTRTLSLHRVVATGPVYRFELVDTETVTGGAASWDVYASPYQLRGSDQDQEHVLHHLNHLPPVVLLLRALSAVVRANELYWLKLFAGRSPDGSLQIDCRLNNDEWLAGADSFSFALAVFPWPPSDRFVSFGQFAVLKPGKRP